MNKLFSGEQLRRLRGRSGMTQASLARELALSPSYLNQIERNQRPLPQSLLHRLSVLFGVALDFFDNTEVLRQAQAVRETMADPLFGNQPFESAEAQRLADAAPEATRRLLLLHRAYRNLTEQLHSVQGRADLPDATGTYEEVRDWVQDRGNHFEVLDHAAETLAEEIGIPGSRTWDALTGRLRDAHGIEVLSEPELLREGTVWRLQRREAQLLLAAEASRESQLFWIAHVIGALEQRNLIDREIRRARLTSESARAGPRGPVELFRRRVAHALPTLSGNCGIDPLRHRAATNALRGKLRAGLPSTEHDAAVRRSRASVLLPQNRCRWERDEAQQRHSVPVRPSWRTLPALERLPCLRLAGAA